MSDHFSTTAVHAGETRRKPYSALTTPIVQTSTYTFSDTGEILDYMRSKQWGDLPERDEYGRYSNPTIRAAEDKLAALEGGERSLLFSSGMGAITTTLLALLSAGDHLILASDSYHRTREFVCAYLDRWGIKSSLVPIDDPQAMEAALRPETRLIFAETPTNPYLRVMDLAHLAELAHSRGLVTLVDSTFATPLNLRPLELGIDLVVHSASKYLGGHNDLLAGAVTGSAGWISFIQGARGVLGGVSNPNDAYLLLRGLKTLGLRIQRQNESGLLAAQYLEDHPAIARVYYPGLESHPDHKVAARLMSGFGGVVSFEIDGDFDKTARFIDNLQLPYIGPTLGGVESIVQQPSALYSLNPLDRQEAGLKDNLVRYAVGVENISDILFDLGQALSKL
jgi:cystathionine gamma-synthase